MSKKIDNWFTEWFDSDHYHLLYQHRNEEEAEAFIQNLFDHLDLKKGSTVLDLACGKGRHALQVHQLGYSVIGLDLSEESIAHAKRHEEEGLSFTRGDMRKLQLEEQFDLTLNLFTSFGYFKSDEEDKMVLKGLLKHLNEGGRIVLDYLNVNHALKNLPSEELILRGDIEFKIRKQLIDGFIVKDIKFQIEDREHHYREFVKNISLKDFKSYFSELNMEIIEIFGDYALNEFNSENSDRLIMIAKPQDS